MDRENTVRFKSLEIYWELCPAAYLEEWAPKKNLNSVAVKCSVLKWQLSQGSW